MSMLARYRKPGGFLQLLNLIETCNKEKQDKLMQLIKSEDPGWAALVITKMLTVDKILSWSPQVLSEVTTQLPGRTLAIILHGKNKDVVDKCISTFSHLQKKEIESVLTEIKPNGGEVQAATIKLIQKVRELDQSRRIQLEKIDPALGLEEMKQAA